MLFLSTVCRNLSRANLVSSHIPSHLKGLLSYSAKPLKLTIKHVTNTRSVQHLTDGLSFRHRKQIGSWLLVCSGLTFTTVVIGGVTRLTKSGLSMVDWHLFKEFPPFGESEWLQEFSKYQKFPEFKIANSDISLSDFKQIWYIEYIHRTLGRLTGAVFILPAAWFWSKKLLTKKMKKRIGAFGSLLLFQGLLGWYMVQSGLEEETAKKYVDPRVSHYRLAAHLGTAFVLYSSLFYTGLSFLLPPHSVTINKQMVFFRKCTHSLCGLVFLTAISGALVAGLDAGLVYNSWPKMADKWIPDDLLVKSPLWKNIFENPTMVQFDHRHLGELVASLTLFAWFYSRRLPLNPRTRLALNCLVATTVGQISLGIVTLLFYVPKYLAAAHQGGSLTVLSAALWVMHELKLVRYVLK